MGCVGGSILRHPAPKSTEAQLSDDSPPYLNAHGDVFSSILLLLRSKILIGL